MNIIGYAMFGLGYGLTFLLLAFGIWVYRKIELRSLTWALAYLILEILSSIIFYGLIQPKISSSPHISTQHFSPIQFETFILSNAVWANVNHLLLAVLLLADCTVLITKAGCNLTGKFARFWRWIYDRSTIFGWVLIAWILVRIIWELLFWRIL